MAKKNKKRKKSRTVPKRRLSLQNEKFVDRDLSWLEFSDRVLAQAADVSLPLLERVKFISIFQSNLDEFVMKRMTLLRFLQATDMNVGVQERIGLIRNRIQSSIVEVDRLYQSLLAQCGEHDIRIFQWGELTSKQKDELKAIFINKILPVLTPIAVDPGHPFPHISNLSTSLAFALQSPGKNEKLFSRVKVPKIFPLLIPLDGSKSHWVFVNEVIENNYMYLFPKMQIKSVAVFRVTRNIEVEPDEDTGADVMAMVENELRERRFGEVVKMEFPKNGDPWLKEFLKAELDITDNDICLRESVLDYAGLSAFNQISNQKLRYKKWSSTVPKIRFDVPDELFGYIAGRDVLVHHPFQSFSGTVEQFIQAAVEDPAVLSIKLTLYRTEENSPLIKSLIRAGELKKQVVCIVELKARFDEERNINWAYALEDAGVHVIYGIVGLKTHAKVALIARKEGENIRCYSHIGTGNYNSQTAKLYTDFGLFTGNPLITDELIDFFHYLTGRSLKSDYKQLLIAPVNMKERLISLIKNEIQIKKQGKPARIIFKCNNLEDFDIGEALYAASQAGVKIDLVIRSICTVRPGIKGLSENIKVLSIVDRFLEHSRVFFFQNGADESEQGSFFIGSADLMFRNLLGRVEVITPLLDKDCKKQIYKCLEIMLDDFCNGWEMQSNGGYRRRGKRVFGLKSSQENLMAYYDGLKNREKKL